MHLSTKHSGQQHIAMTNFTGGLNSISVPEMIGDNQLAEMINLEIDKSTGLLRTCYGTVTLHETDKPIRALMYDKVNFRYFYVSEKDIYKTNFFSSNFVGKLTGPLFPVYTDWEDGILIASGGKLQYWNGKKLATIDSPDANGVYVSAGRVFIYSEHMIRCSGVGDETNWKENNDDPSASKFIDVGYKDGGRIIGVVNLSSDTIIIKDNGRVYRLEGNYPNWSIREVSRNVDCMNRLSFCAITNSVLVLGANSLQVINTTQDYGDMKAENIAQNIANMFYQLPLSDSRVVYVPPLNQVWILSTRSNIIVYDLNFNCFFERKFNSDVVDVLSVNDTVYIARQDKITQLFPSIFYDEAYSKDEQPIEWSFKAKSLVSFNAFLVKRVAITYTPFQVSTAKIVGNTEKVVGNKTKIYPIKYSNKDKRGLSRNKTIEITGSGAGFGMLLNKIEFDVVEV